MNVSKRIERLSDSPCKKCGKEQECKNKCKVNSKFYDIVDFMFGNAEADYNWCPIYIALTAPDMIEEDIDE